MPCLVINARRAEANRLDIICCAKAKDEHKRNEPQGCCSCLLPCNLSWKPGQLENFMENIFGKYVVTSLVGQIVTVTLFLALGIVGVIGIFNIQQDFKLEWFLPDDSYVVTFIQDNDQHFASGPPFTIYTTKMDYFAQQSSMIDLHSFLNSSSYIDQVLGITDWHHSYLVWAEGNEFTSQSFVNGQFISEATYYSELYSWVSSGAGSMYGSSIIWNDDACNNALDTCDPTSGICASQIGAYLDALFVQEGYQRFETMTTVRQDISSHLSNAFPYSYEFIFWEEAGIVGKELVCNLVL